MKKILALGLAVAMVLSMGAVVMAKANDAKFQVGSISENAYLFDSDNGSVDMGKVVTSVSYGKTLYYPLMNNAANKQVGTAEQIVAAEAAVVAAQAVVDGLAADASEKDINDANNALANARTALEAIANYKYVHESDAVSGIKIKQKWEENGKLIDSVSVVKKKVMNAATVEKYLYFVEVVLKASTSTSESDINGTIEFRKTGEFDYEDMNMEVNMSVAYPVADKAEISKDLQIFKEGEGFEGDSEEEFTFKADNDSYFVVNTQGQAKLLLSMTTKYDSAVADAYPDANLDFFYGNGGTFNKTGTLYISAEAVRTAHGC